MFLTPIPSVMQMIKPETRASLIKFLQLLAAHHPSTRYDKPLYSFFSDSTLQVLQFIFPILDHLFQMPEGCCCIASEL